MKNGFWVPTEQFLLTIMTEKELFQTQFPRLRNLPNFTFTAQNKEGNDVTVYGSIHPQEGNTRNYLNKPITHVALKEMFFEGLGLFTKSLMEFKGLTVSCQTKKEILDDMRLAIMPWTREGYVAPGIGVRPANVIRFQLNSNLNFNARRMPEVPEEIFKRYPTDIVGSLVFGGEPYIFTINNVLGYQTQSLVDDAAIAFDIRRMMEHHWLFVQRAKLLGDIKVSPL